MKIVSKRLFGFLTLLLAAFIISSIYREDFGKNVTIGLIAVLLVSLVVLLLIRCFFSFRMSAKPGKLIILLKNKMFAPILNGELKMVYHYVQQPERETVSFPFTLSAGGRKQLTVNLTTPYAGAVRLCGVGAVVYGYLSILGLKANTKKEELSELMLLFPQTVDLEILDKRSSVVNGGLSEFIERFDPNKTGDDPSEVKDYRGFQPGDRLSGVHWKLSAKRGELMIKEHAFLKLAAVLVVLDNSACSQEVLNDRLVVLYSLCEALLAQKIGFVLAVVDGETGLTKETFVYEEEEWQVLSEALLSEPLTEKPDWDLVFAELLTDRFVPNLMFVTTELEDELMDHLSGLMRGQNLQLFSCGENKHEIFAEPDLTLWRLTKGQEKSELTNGEIIVR